MKPLSLQWRVLLLAGVVVATVSLFGLGIAVRERQQSGEREFRDSARSLSLALLPVLRNTLVVGDMATAQQAFDPIVRVGAVRRIALLRPADRQVMIESANAVAMEKLASPPVWFRSLSGVHDHVEEFPVDVGGVGYGVLRLEMSDSAMMRELWESTLRFLWVGAASLAGIVALLGFMLRQGLGPLRRVAEGAHRLAAGEWSARLEPAALPEIAEVVRAFNALGEEIESAIGQLRQSEARLKEAQRMAQLGNWELDLVNNVLTWSDEIYRIFELDAANFGASYEAFLDAIHPDDRERVNRAYTDSVAKRTPYDIVHRLLMKDGRVKYVNERCETFYDDGRPLRSAGTVHDVTERHLAEDTVRSLNQELEQRVAERTVELQLANQELESFSYSVSHDLRAPLRAIDGFSRILLEDYYDRLDEDGRHYLNVVSDNARRMRQLIDDILAFSRMSRQDIQAEPMDLAALVSEVFGELKALVPERNIDLRLGRLPAMRGDRAMMRQVVLNLLVNAVKFTAPRSQAVIEVSGATQAAENVYCVKDNGVGFDIRFREKLFGVFQRLHSQEEFEGTGIGLAIVKGIIARHGGRVWAEGKPGEGAAFYFSLPGCEGLQPGGSAS
jgi:PAS domain S-box-containing protein